MPRKIKHEMPKHARAVRQRLEFMASRRTPQGFDEFIRGLELHKNEDGLAELEKLAKRYGGIFERTAGIIRSQKEEGGNDDGS